MSTAWRPPTGTSDASPGEYARRLAHRYSYRTKCPVDERPIDATQATTVVGSVKVFFCSDQCGRRFGERPDKHATSPEEQAVRLHY